MSDKSASYSELKRFIDDLWIVDTHEHLVPETNRVLSEVDPLSTFLNQYVSSDLVSSGMSHDDLEMIRDPSMPLKERWEIFAPHWRLIQKTGYSRAIKIAVRDLYGFDGITDENYFELTKKMRLANKKGLYKWVLRDKSKIEFSIIDPLLGSLDSSQSPLKQYNCCSLVFTYRFEDFLLLLDRSSLESLSAKCGIAIHSLSDLVKAFEIAFGEASKSLVCVKIALAYNRPIFFEKTTFNEAEKAFNKLSSQRLFRRVTVDGGRRTLPEGVPAEEMKTFQDFMVHRLIHLAIKHNLPVQIHTGLQEGNENIITSANPTDLTNLFMEYKEARFDIFHGSYPYVGELAVLAKNFQNVYIDMAWLHIISPYVARRALSEWLDTVPSNKILGFGGDYVFVEGIYGHSVLARDNVARVLAKKVEEEGYSLVEAKELARMILRDNALNLFSLKA